MLNVGILNSEDQSRLGSNRSFIESIYSVRWRQNGGMLASAFRDGTAALSDSKTGKKLLLDTPQKRVSFLCLINS